MSLSSLEAEKQAILERMHARRETYRRMLIEGTDLDTANMKRIPPTMQGMTVYRHVDEPQHFPRSAVMRTVMDHPFLVALGVAAVVAIGPRRIMRVVSQGAAAAGTLSTPGDSTTDMIGKVLTLVGTFAQARGSTQ
ncbi:MAG TPA: hypothetical protein VJ698_11075 [Noviherbaspirillum sp.]|uniref:hypothetical protein n=1 Tax=Noviherbaspirillum sp. TaxID=1926288 RepID=UPI002B46EDA0|nr:hypothetical protein [Noviherbaspirillum sp.]HJV86005.1 hypothetical protein [Noviherbaspirillum sp.]